MGCLVAYSNIIDRATLSGGSWLGTLPLANLQQRSVQRLARSSSDALSSTQFTATWPAAVSASIVALVGHNISALGRWRVRFSDAADFSTLTWDTGWMTAWALESAYDMSFEDANWWLGEPSQEDIEGFTWTSATPVIYALGRYMRVEIDDEDNPAGYVQIGRVFVGRAWAPARGMAVGAEIGYESRSQIRESLAGAVYAEAREPLRRAAFDLPALAEADGLRNALGIQRLVSTHGEVLFTWAEGDTAHRARRTFLGRLAKLNPLRHPYYALTETSFEIMETR